MNIYLQSAQYQWRKDAVTYVLSVPSLLKPGEADTMIVNSTEADIRATMAVPADNWGNADALVDCQNKVTALYPDWDFTVVPQPEEE